MRRPGSESTREGGSFQQVMGDRCLWTLRVPRQPTNLIRRALCAHTRPRFGVPPREFDSIPWHSMFREITATRHIRESRPPARLLSAARFPMQNPSSVRKSSAKCARDDRSAVKQSKKQRPGPRLGIENPIRQGILGRLPYPASGQRNSSCPVTRQSTRHGPPAARRTPRAPG